MDSNLVQLQPEIMRRCEDHVARVNFKNSVSYRGAEKDLRLQALAKMAECAACIYAGMDPVVKLSWLNVADGGSDFRWGRATIDVKHSVHAGFLVWPIKKISLFEKKPFDVLMFVSGREDGLFTLRGWTSKVQFRDEHKVAGVGHKLDEGTWYMESAELWSASALRSAINEGWF